MGIGLDGYHNPTHNTLPVYVDLRRFLHAQEKSSLFTFLNLGVAIKPGPEFKKGFLFSWGLGYRIKLRKISLLPSIGINIQNIADSKVVLFDPATSRYGTIIDKISLSSVSYNLAIQF